MSEEINSETIIEKIGTFDRIEILVNDKREMLFEGIIDAPYIEIHFRRILKTSRHFDIVKLMGFRGNRIRESIAEVFVNKNQ
ncbi:MAG: hypothetical protein ACJ75J_04700 [Cytophagaceae bacterium]